MQSLLQHVPQVCRWQIHVMLTEKLFHILSSLLWHEGPNTGMVILEYVHAIREEEIHWAYTDFIFLPQNIAE